jgi:hypothetical protein
MQGWMSMLTTIFMWLDLGALLNCATKKQKSDE